MSSPDRARRRHRPSIALPIVLWFAVVTALLPVLRVIRPDAWLAGAVGVVGLVLIAGWTARALRAPAVAVSLAEAAVAGLALTAVFARETAILGVIPSIETFRSIPLAVDGAARQIIEGAAPLEASADLAFVIVASCALLAIALDHVVVTARMPLLAVVALIAVYLIPAIAVPSGPRAIEFVLFGAALLLLLGVDTRVRERARLAALEPPAHRAGAAPETSPRPAGGVIAAAIGAGAVVVALVVAPALPQPTRATGNGTFVAGSAIDASLSLGENLRQPASIEVLRVDSAASLPPYLRAVTLSEFDGVEWEHDQDDGRILTDDGFGGVDVSPDVRVDEFTTTIDVVNYVSPWLPIPYAAVTVDGLDGEWIALDENRTLLTRGASPVGQSYEVTSQVVRPTLEQIRGAQAVEPAGGRDTSALDAPEDLLAPIRATAQEVTAGLANDYDRLVALQTWFRGTFQYSLDAPVEDGFDGTGLEAIDAFLQERAGYCVHFASAFAVMARTLDMPSRIVVGYLPGTLSADFTAAQSYYSVASTQLHAWPEVFFEGLGWIPFEPTASLGTPTRFAPGVSGDTPTSPDRPDAVEPEAPETDPTAVDDAPQLDAGDVPVGGGTTTGTSPAPALAIIAAALVVLAAPGGVRAIARARRLRVAGGADEREAAVAAWDEVVDTAADLGLARHPGESPRAFGARLRDGHGAPAESIETVVAAIERASYAAVDPARAAVGGPDDRLGSATRDVRGGLLAGSPLPPRLLAAVLPRSLALRAGSALAAGRTAEAR